MTPSLWAALVAYSLCLVMAAATVPSLWVFLFYGLPTWFGGVLFAVIVRALLGLRGRA